MGILSRLLICIGVTILLAYCLIRQQNQLIELKLQIPRVVQEIEALEEKNTRLRYLVKSFENPMHLIELARLPEFGYLKHPFIEDIVFLVDPTVLTPGELEN